MKLIWYHIFTRKSLSICSMSWGQPVTNSSPHTRENTHDDLEIISGDLQIDISKPKQFTKLEGQSYIRLGTTPQEEQVSTSKNIASPPTPLLDTSYNKYHQTYESDKTENSTDIELSTLFVYTMHSAIPFLDISTATMLSSVINLCNSIVGAAILGLPYAASHVGWLTAIILLIICSLISQFTFQLQTSAGIIFNRSTNSLTSSYYTLSKATQVPKLQIISDCTILLTCFGACTAYLIIIGDLMPDVIIHVFGNQTSHLVQDRRSWIGFFMIFLIIPATILRKLNALRFTSLIAIICFLCITTVMFIYLYNDTVNICNDIDNNSCGIIAFKDFKSTSDITAFFKAIPIYFFAFGSHPLAFAITNELINSTNSRLNIVILLSFIATTILYIIISLLAYFTFGENVNSNILTNYPQNQVLVSLIRIWVSLAVAFSYPVVFTPGRHSLSTLIWRKNATQITTQKFYGVTICMMIITFTIAMIVDDLGIVLSVIGSTGSAVSIMILPGLFYYFMKQNTGKNIKQNFCDKVNTYGSIITVSLGVILVPFCLIILFQ
eukprot:526183_1